MRSNSHLLFLEVKQCSLLKNRLDYLFTLFLAVLGLRRTGFLSLVVASRGLLLVSLHGLLIGMASVTVEHGFCAHGLQ